MESTYAENREPEIRRGEEHESERESNIRSHEGIKGDSPELGSIGERTARTGWTQTSEDTDGGGYHGGMLDQMIVDCEDRLAEAEACLEWYENVKQRELKRRENLRKLEEMRDKELEEQKQKAQS